MPLELTPRTAAGARLLALADVLAEDFATRAPAHDRDASYPHASIDALKDAGYFAAPIPPRYGGLGAESVHDLVLASSRLARGDASVAIGVNMHLVAVLNMVRRWRIAVAGGHTRRAAAFAASMRQIAKERVVLAAAVSEPGQDLTRPRTTATRTDTGWRIDGRKIFCTMSPAATTLYTAVTFRDDRGAERYGYALVPVDTPGVVVHDDWNALGMRASGSNSVTLDGVEVPDSVLRGGFPLGHAAPFMERNLAAGLFHASASLGIAEAAQQHALDAIGARGRGADDARTRSLAAESAIEMTVCRAALARGAGLIDEHEAAHPATHGSDEELVALFSEAQAIKTYVNEAAARLVDRALALAGGAAFRSGHPIARAYRDVRAGAFMNPLASGRAYELIGQVALGLKVSLS
jgi:alkylation response protein AidB-like acyl-CoA dehydrogenase